MTHQYPVLIAGLLGAPTQIYAVVYAAGIVGLFRYDGSPSRGTTKALGIPGIWLFLISSRFVSQWLGLAPSGNSSEIYLDGNPIDRVVFLVLLALGLWVVIQRGGRVEPLLQRNPTILLFFFYCAVSVIWSDFPLTALKRWIKAVGDLVMVLVVLTEPEPLQALRLLVTRLGFVLFPLSVLFIKYFPHLGRLMTKSWMYEFTGVTTQKNTLGMICLVYGLTFLWSFRSAYRNRQDLPRRRRHHLVAYGAVLVMIVWLLRTSDAMTSLIGLVMASAIMLLASRPSLVRKPALVHLLVVAVLGGSLFALFFDTGGTLVHSLGRNTTLTGRTEIWNMVLKVPINPLLGAGFESFWLGERLEGIRIESGAPLNEAHSGFLELYLNLGWIGVSLLALLLLAGYRKVIARWRKDSNSGSLFLGYFLAALIYSLTEAGFRMMTVSWMFLLLAAMAASQPIRNRTMSPSPAGQIDQPPVHEPHEDLCEAL
jgi:O-antigen ligase